MAAPLGSKANPSQYDCYPDLGEDEPYFVIRAKDPLAAAIVELHAYIGAGQSGAAHNKLADGRATGTAHFELEWAQAILMLVMLGRQHLDEAGMRAAVEAEMGRQRERWSAGP